MPIMPFALLGARLICLVWTRATAGLTRGAGRGQVAVPPPGGRRREGSARDVADGCMPRLLPRLPVPRAGGDRIAVRAAGCLRDADAGPAPHRPRRDPRRRGADVLAHRELLDRAL